MEGTIYSLIPPLIMLILVLLTRNVLVSLGAGIVVGGFMLHDFVLGDSVKEIWNSFMMIFYMDGTIQWGNIYLFFFLALLGITTAFMTASGGSQAFGEWAIKRIKTRKGAQLMPAVLGIIIFIDDYFNSLAIGQVARPVTDRYKVSRAKLAYLIDSTSAPVTVISPISSWGAFIIGTLGGILATHGITDISELEAFVKMVPLNLYVFAAILLVFLSIFMKVDLGAMKKHEDRAQQTGELVTKGKVIPGDLDNAFVEHHNGKVIHLIAPIVALFISTVAAMILTGMQAVEGQVHLLSIFAATNVTLSLFIGGLVAVMTSVVLYIKQPQPKTNVWKVMNEGTKSMLPAIYILIFAWMIGSIIESLQTGTYLANTVEAASISPSYLPLLIFVVSGLMAFATGTSWGTFGVMLPIAGEIAVQTDIQFLLPSLAAVLAGSVFGDHCSPISDTSILSSTGAGSNHIDHVMTQLPYALISAVATGVGYIVFGITTSTMLALTTTLVIVLVVALLCRAKLSQA
ncbi:Na+/H+ antiporter NhaC family protein [Pontibacillus litoralis]|uniref:Sodium:proton antiporter n=1 Tax=Pontibacillus litoralis JSM 072002 TaxID=1385512 RepID=A0A0A5HSR9_9BACI|nr:Na+/H+ antiporter NhaC family protein [Pontibacillus litoralis]KGX86692.1 sodium:proton antiporter [Pontibacillus litoralis JSM 072002]